MKTDPELSLATKGAQDSNSEEGSLWNRRLAVGGAYFSWRSRFPLFLFCLLLFIGAVLWARGRDPFERVWFRVHNSGSPVASCIAVLPKTAARPLPVVVYLHGSGGSIMTSGEYLRQIAELGLAAIGMEYCQTNEAIFEAQFTALLHRLEHFPWADTNRVSWVGYSLGAQRQLDYWMRHPEGRPNLIVRLGGGVNARRKDREDAKSCGREEGTDLRLGGLGVFALKKKANIEHPTSNIEHRSEDKISSLRLGGLRVFALKIPFLWILAIVLALVAVGQMGLRLVLPRMAAGPGTIAWARTLLVQTRERGDFDFLVAQGDWRGHTIGALVEQAHLANYNRQLVNWQVPELVYREFVLTPQIDPALDGALDWRRLLWESLYPRIRKEPTPQAAAEIISRHLQERLTLVDPAYQPGSIRDFWLRQVTDPRGFQALHVAAMRACGIPARLGTSHQAELWADSAWHPAPQPLAISLQ
jgi:hypothetical protein